MGYALGVEFVGFIILFGMFRDFGVTPVKERHQKARETTCQYVGRSVRVWLGYLLFRGLRAKGRHSYGWRYPSGRQHQVRVCYA